MSNILATTYDAAIAVTKSDTLADPQGPFAGLFVAVAGIVRFVDGMGNEITTGSLAAGTVVPIVVTRVFNTTTAATVFGLRAAPYKPRVAS